MLGGTSVSRVQVPIPTYKEPIRYTAGAPDFLTALNPTLTEALGRMAPDQAAIILQEASGDARALVFQTLRLQSNGKPLRKLPPRLPWSELTPEIQRQIVQLPSGAPFLAARLVLSWWGRRAAIDFRGTKLGTLIESKPLEDRLLHALEAYDPESAEVPLLQTTYALETSPHTLDKLFIRLLTDPLRPLLPEPNDASGPAADQGDRSPPNNTTSMRGADEPAPEVSAAVDPTPCPDVLSPPIADGPALDLKTPPPESLRPKSPSSPSSDNLTQVRHAIERYRDRKIACAECVSAGRFAELTEIAKQAITARQAIDDALSALGPRFADVGVVLPGLEEDHLKDDEAIGAFLGHIVERFAVADAQRAQLLAREIAAFAADLRALEIEPPPELPAVESKAALAALKEHWHSRLDQERAYRCLLRGEAPPALFAEMALDVRLALYGRAASASPRSAANLLSWLRGDCGVLADAPRAVLQVLTRIVSAELDNGRSLPGDLWALVADVSGGSTVDAMQSTGILEFVAVAPEAQINLPELLPTVADALDRLPPTLRWALQRLIIDALPVQQQVARLSAFALEADAPPQIVALLVERLVEAGQHRQALLVTALAARVGPVVPMSRAVTQAIIAVLLESAMQDQRTHDVISALVDDGVWLTSSTEGIAALLFLAAVTGHREWYDSLRFQRSEVLELAAAERPALIRDWLQTDMLSEETPEQRARRRLQIAEARQALAQWDHDIQKRSCYSGWDFYATKYQLLFRERLTATMRRIESAGAMPDLSAEEILTEASLTGLPRVDGDGRKAMILYLEKQIERLGVIARAAPQFAAGRPLREALASSEEAARAALAAEAADDRGNPILPILYRKALETVHER